MTHSVTKAPLYPKSHILAASGVAALLSLALLVFPTREVEAKKTYLELELDSGAEQALREESDRELPLEANAGESSPFASIEQPEESDGNPQTADASETPEDEVVATDVDPLSRSITVASGDTLSTVFAKVGLASNVVHDLLASSKEAKRISRIHVGQVLDFDLTADGQLAQLRTSLSPLETVSIDRSGEGYRFTREQVKPTIEERYTHGVIDSSLFVAAKKAGLSNAMTFDLANIFGYDIDFAMDLREGDDFEVIYENKTVDGARVGNGEILAARFTNRGKTYTAVRYVDARGNASYFNADGESLRKAFIRTPVDFARISSRFSNGRKHPILNKIRAHKGVDYAAPRGTPIKAAGDGKIAFAGRRGGYGNTIILQHGTKYRTLYAHMQGFAKGISSGGSVRQGQVIGYIGTTGLSTGPHLHYEFQVNGVHVDPLSQKLALMADPLSGKEKQRFLKTSKPLMARLDEERATALAMNKP